MYHALLRLSTAFLVIASASATLSAQQILRSWSLYGLEETEPVDGIRVSDTSFIVLARSSTPSSRSGNTEAVVVCYSTSGDVIWRTGTDSNSYFYPIRILPALQGWSIVGRDDKAVVMLSIDGDGNFYDKVALPSVPKYSTLRMTTFWNGDIGLVSSNPYLHSIHIYCYSKQGSLKWDTQVDFDDPTDVYGAERIDDDIVVACRVVPADTSVRRHTVVLRIPHNTGKVVWQYSYEDPEHEFCTGLTALSDGTLVVCGFHGSSAYKGSGALSLLHLNGNGTPLARLADDTYDRATPSDIIQGPKGRIFVALRDTGSVGRLANVTFGEIPDVAFIDTRDVEWPIRLVYINDSEMAILQRAVRHDPETNDQTIHVGVSIFTTEMISDVNEFGPGVARAMDFR